jgi:hypothetical protein
MACPMCHGEGKHVPLTLAGHEGQVCPNKLIEQGKFIRVVQR